MSKNVKNLKFVVKLQRPVCRTPIKPRQAHKIDVRYTRKFKNAKKAEMYE